MAGLVDKIKERANASGFGNEPKTDRRSHPRVRDAIGLVVRPLMSLPAAGENGDKTGAGVSVSPQGSRSKVRKNNKYDISGYAEVKSQYPEVAQYISDLEERIRTLLLQGDSPSENPTHITSLSAGGIAFAEDILLQVDEQVSLQITLFPSLQRISCDATIVSVGDAPEIGFGDRHTYRASFTRIADEDKAIIEAHVSKLLGGLTKADFD